MSLNLYLVPQLYQMWGFRSHIWDLHIFLWFIDCILIPPPMTIFHTGDCTNWFHIEGRSCDCAVGKVTIHGLGSLGSQGCWAPWAPYGAGLHTVLGSIWCWAPRFVGSRGWCTLWALNGAGLPRVLGSRGYWAPELIGLLMTTVL